MTIFDLLFIALFLTSVVTLLTAAVSALRGRGAQALGILRTFAICFAIYMAIVFVAALASPQKVFHLNEDRCFDDWCIAVTAATRTPTNYAVTLRISSHAGRVVQRENGVIVYLVDDQARRFDPSPDPTATPLNVQLTPGQSVGTRRSFPVPPDAHGLGLVVAHEGSFCFPGCFIIGEDANPLHKRTIVALPQ